MKPVIQFVPDSNRAVARFPISPDIIHTISTMEGRSIWLKSGALSFLASKSNVNKLRNRFPDIQILGGESEQKVKFTGQIEYKTEPYPHQVKGVEFLSDKPHACIFAEQGTGKSKIAIDHAVRLHNGGDTDCTLIISPAGVHKQWVDSELHKHCASNYTAWYPQSSTDYKSWINGQIRGMEIVSVSYGIAASENFHFFWAYFFSHFEKVLLILDESHFVKNQSTKRWKAIKSVADKCTFRIAMSGTPISKTLVDEYSQLKIVDENIIGISTMAGFKTEYYVNHKLDPSKSEHSINRFKKVVEPFTFRVTKSILDIHPKTYSIWKFDMHLRQKKAFITMANELYVELERAKESGESSKALFEFQCQALVKLRQIGSGFVIDPDGTPNDIIPPQSNPRLAALCDIVKANVYGREQLIIWHTFQYERELIADLFDRSLPHLRLGIYRGSGSGQIVDKFCNREIDVMLANPRSGGTGLNLHYGGCRLAVYFSHDDHAIARWQSEDRIHRIGQKGICEFIDIVANGSTDPNTLLRTLRKKRLSQMTLGDFVDELKGYLK